VKHIIKQREANDDQARFSLPNNIYTYKFQTSQSEMRAESIRILSARSSD